MEKKTRKTIVALSTIMALSSCDSPVSENEEVMSEQETITIFIGNYTSPRRNVELKTVDGAHITDVNIYDTFNSGTDYYSMLKVELPKYETVKVYATSWGDKQEREDGVTLEGIIHLQDSASYTLKKPMGVEFVDSQIVEYYPDVR